MQRLDILVDNCDTSSTQNSHECLAELSGTVHGGNPAQIVALHNGRVLKRPALQFNQAFIRTIKNKSTGVDPSIATEGGPGPSADWRIDTPALETDCSFGYPPDNRRLGISAGTESLLRKIPNGDPNQFPSGECTGSTTEAEVFDISNSDQTVVLSNRDSSHSCIDICRFALKPGDAGRDRSLAASRSGSTE